MVKRSCQKCRRIFETNEKQCIICKEESLTRNFQGTVVIFDVNSEVAKKLNITAPGKYAIKV